MHMQSDHSIYLSKTNFKPACDISHFPQAHQQMIVTYGHWLTALMEGRIAPDSHEQRHFVSVCSDQAEPDSVIEHAWSNYLLANDLSSYANEDARYCFYEEGEAWCAREHSSHEQMKRRR